MEARFTQTVDGYKMEYIFTVDVEQRVAFKEQHIQDTESYPLFDEDIPPFVEDSLNEIGLEIVEGS